MSSPYQEYHYYSGDNTSGKNGLELINKVTFQLKGLHDVTRICELGCGNGYFANVLSKLGYKVTGIDASESAIKYAKRKYEGAAEFVHAGIDQNLFKRINESEFDLVIAKEVIEHLYCPDDLVQAAKILLRKDGYLCLTTPYHGYVKNLAIALLGRTDQHFNPLWKCGHIKFFSIRSLKELLQSNGFHVIHFTFSAECLGYGKA